MVRYARATRRESGADSPLFPSVLKQDETIDGGTETKRLRAEWNTKYLEHLLGQL